jgi:hypothetical protein
MADQCQMPTPQHCCHLCPCQHIVVPQQHPPSPPLPSPPLPSPHHIACVLRPPGALQLCQHPISTVNTHSPSRAKCLSPPAAAPTHSPQSCAANPEQQVCQVTPKRHVSISPHAVSSEPAAHTSTLTRCNPPPPPATHTHSPSSTACLRHLQL